MCGGRDKRPLQDKKLHNLFEVEMSSLGNPKVASGLATLGFVA